MSHTRQDGYVWIIKPDGTLQCEEGHEIGLSVMGEELGGLEIHVANSEKRYDPIVPPTVCGAPTGQVNAYQIAQEDWQKLQNTSQGALGFRLDSRDIAVEGRDGGSIRPADDVLPWPRK